MNSDEPDAQIRSRLERGHRRVNSATPGSPEWDAALAHTDALEHQLEALRPIPSLEGEHVVSRLAPIMLEDRWMVHGIVAARGPDGETLRIGISEIPDRVHTRHEFAEALEALARHAEFIVEFEEGERELSFYAWDPELHPSRAPERDQDVSPKSVSRSSTAARTRPPR